MNRKRRRWLVAIALLLVLGSSGAWWFQARRLPKITFEPRAEPFPRVLIHNGTNSEFWQPAEGGCGILYRVQEGVGWTEPNSASEPDGECVMLMRALAPDECLQIDLPRRLLSGQLRPRAPYQLGVCLIKEPPKWTGEIRDWFGRWLPDSFGRPCEVWIWSETITP